MAIRLAGGEDYITKHADLEGLAADDHTQYQKESEKDAASGYAGLNASSEVIKAIRNIKSGLDAAKEASPSVGDAYVATDTDKFYICFSAGVWTEVSGGASTFLSLTDTPASYAGQAGQFLKVNATPDALEFVDHIGEADPHSQYQKESEKGAAGGYASLDGASVVVQQPPDHDASKITSGTLAVARIPDGVRTAVITFIIDGGGSVITTGEKGHLEIPFACTIERVTMLADQSGSIVVDIWKDSYANFPPTDADSITGASPPTISSGQKSQDSTLPGWTTGINAGDILAFNVDSIATCERVLISLKVKKT